jgi:hypothetical protein
MNNSIRAIIDRALDDTEYPADAYNTAEHVDTQFDDNVEKLASALDFLGGNLNNIGTPEEKLLELYEFNKLANEGAAVVEGATDGAKAGGAPVADAAAAGPKNPYKNVVGSRTKHRIFAEGAEAGITHGMERGKLSADALQGMKNTWNSGAGGKAALIAGGVGLLGAGALAGGALKTGSYNNNNKRGDLMYRFGLNKEASTLMDGDEAFWNSQTARSQERRRRFIKPTAGRSAPQYPVGSGERPGYRLLGYDPSVGEYVDYGARGRIGEGASTRAPVDVTPSSGRPHGKMDQLPAVRQTGMIRVSPTESRAAAKAAVEEGGHFSRHGLKYGLGAGALGLGALAYNRRKKNRR